MERKIEVEWKGKVVGFVIVKSEEEISRLEKLHGIIITTPKGMWNIRIYDEKELGRLKAKFLFHPKGDNKNAS